MPLSRLLIILAGVLLAAAATLFVASLAAPQAFHPTLSPAIGLAALAAAVALRFLVRR